MNVSVLKDPKLCPEEIYFNTSTTTTTTKLNQNLPHVLILCMQKETLRFFFFFSESEFTCASLLKLRSGDIVALFHICEVRNLAGCETISYLHANKST